MDGAYGRANNHAAITINAQRLAASLTKGWDASGRPRLINDAIRQWVEAEDDMKIHFVVAHPKECCKIIDKIHSFERSEVPVNEIHWEGKKIFKKRENCFRMEKYSSGQKSEITGAIVIKNNCMCGLSSRSLFLINSSISDPKFLISVLYTFA